MMCGFQRFLEACIHEVFAEYQQRLRMFLCKTTFAENWFFGGLRNLMMKMVFAVCLRMCMLDNKLQTFFNLVLFQRLCGREVLWNWFYVFAACERLGTTFLENVMFIFNNSCMADFH